MMGLMKRGWDSLLDSVQDETITLDANHSGFSDESFAFNTIMGGVGSQAGEIVSPIKGLMVPAQFACVKVISEDVGKLPFIPYKRIDDMSKERLVNGAIARVLRKEATINMTPMTFKQTVTQWAVNWGNGYAEIVRNSRGEPVQLWPIHPSRVKIIRDKSGEVVYVVRFNDGSRMEIPGRDIIHIRGLGDELYGWNLPVSVAKETLGIAIAQIIFASSFFGNSVTPSAILMHPKNLSDKAQRRLRSGMRKTFGGARNASKLMILEEDMKYQTISMPMKQAQFLESRNFSVEEIARYHRMPLHKIQSMKQATNNNIEQQALEYIQDTLDPWLIRWESEINLKFWPNTENFFAEFLLDSMLRGDFESRTDGYVKLWNIGVLSQNMILAKENMNPIPNGDTHFVPLNMVPLDQAVLMSADLNAGRDNQRQIDDEEAETARRDMVVASFSVVLTTAASRLVQMETKALQRTHTKGLFECANTTMDFYLKHQVRMSEALLPHTEAYFNLLGVATTDLEVDLKASCYQFCEEAKGEINLALGQGSGNIKGILDKWGASRAQDIAKAIVGIGLACYDKSVKINKKGE